MWMGMRRTLLRGARGATVALIGTGLPLVSDAALGTRAQEELEFHVNTYTTGAQSFPAVCAAAAGGFVVVWESGVPLDDGDGQDGSFLGVFGQRFAPGGARLGEEFAVNSYTTDYQAFPAVACDDAGNFVVVWSSFLQDGDSDGIFAQRFNSGGAPAGSEFRVNSYTRGAQSYPRVGSDREGNFVIVWSSTGQDGDGNGVFAQRYSSSGAPRGSEFQVNTYTAGNQSYPDVAVDAGGGFVVVWASDSQDGGGPGIFARRFVSSGLPVGNELQVHAAFAAQAPPAVDADDEGGFVVAWTQQRRDGKGHEVVARRYGPDGGATGSEFPVNTYTTGDQVMPAVALTATGDFVVAWTSYGQDGSDGGIFARRFAEGGVPRGSEFQVNTFTPGAQYSAAVSITDGGDFVLAWASHQEGGSFSEIIARWYAAPTATFTMTRSPTATAGPSPNASVTSTATRTRTPTAPRSPSPTPSPSPSPTATVDPSSTPTDTAAPTATETEVPTPTVTPSPLSGDCSSDGRVTIDEVLLAINVAFGKATLDECKAADRSQDGIVTIEEIVAAVNAVLATA